MKLAVQETIQAAPEAVFRAYTDFEHAAEHISAITKMEMLTPGPVRVGTRFKETRVFGKRESSETMEVTALDPPRAMTLEAQSCGCHYTSQFHFDAAGPDGPTTVRMEFRGKPVQPLAWLFVPLGYLMKGMMRRCLEKDFADMKARLER